MIRIVCVGNLKEKYLIDACNEYIKRITKFDKIEIIECKESTLKPYSLALKNEACEIDKHLKGYVIKLAIEGNSYSSEQFAKKFEQIKINGYSDITFIIGSSFGLDKCIRSDESFSFSKLTFPHQLARLMLLEQIYRVETILHHTPYHK